MKKESLLNVAMRNPREFEPTRMDSIRNAFSNVYDWYGEASDYFEDVIPHKRWSLNLLDNELGFNSNRFGDFQYTYSDEGDFPTHKLNWSRPFKRRR